MVSVARTASGTALRWLARAGRVRWPRRVWWIVNYHDVSDDAMALRPATPVAAFRRHVEALRTYFTVVSLEEGFARLEAGAIDRPLASVTFDDGYAGVAENAYPILERLKVPATVFVCGSALVEYRELWDIAVHRLVHAGRAGDVSRLTGLDCRDLPAAAAVARLRGRWTLELADALVRRARAVTSPARARFMTLDMLRRLDPAVLRIGNHTWSHAPLASLSRAQMIEEIGRTHGAIRGLPGFTPVFAWPFGDMPDVSAESACVAQEAFGLRVLSAYGGFNRTAGAAIEDARRVGLDDDARLPWDLTASAIGSVIRNALDRAGGEPAPARRAPPAKPDAHARRRLTLTGDHGSWAPPRS